MVMQFSLLNGSIHDSWLQQGHEGMPMDEEMRGKCEVLACTKQHVTEPHRKKPDRASEVHNSLKAALLSCFASNRFLFLFNLGATHVSMAAVHFDNQ